MRASEIRVKRIRVNQGLGVYQYVNEQENEIEKVQMKWGIAGVDTLPCKNDEIASLQQCKNG